MCQTNLQYKTAMNRLEEILTRLDESDMGDDELSSQVQEATSLLRQCRQILTETEKNVQEALTSLDGEIEEAP